MRRLISFSLALAVQGGLFAVPGYAQRGAYPSRGMARSGYASSSASAARGSYSRAGEADLLRPYASRAPSPRYSRYSRPVMPTRSQIVARPAAPARGVGDYFPTMRVGQGPNHNVINPRSLCVPGRRALLVR